MEKVTKIYQDVLRFFHDRSVDLSEGEELLQQQAAENYLHFYFLLTKDKEIEVGIFQQEGKNHHLVKQFVDNDPQWYDFLREAKCSSFHLGREKKISHLVHFFDTANGSSWPINRYLERVVYSTAIQNLQRIISAISVVFVNQDVRNLIKNIHAFSLEIPSEQLTTREIKQSWPQGVTWEEEWQVEVEPDTQTARIVKDNDTRYFITSNRQPGLFDVWVATQMNNPRIAELNIPAIERSWQNFFTQHHHHLAKFLIARDKNEVREVHLLFDEERLDLEHKKPLQLDAGYLRMLNQYTKSLESFTISQNVNRFDLLSFALSLRDPSLTREGRLRSISVNPIRLGIIDVESQIKEIEEQKHKEIEELQSKLAQIAKEKEQAEQEVERLRSNLAKVVLEKNKAKEAESELAEVTKKFTDLQQAHENLQQENEDLKVQLAQADERVDSLSQEVETLQDELTESLRKSSIGPKSHEQKLQEFSDAPKTPVHSIKDIKQLSKKFDLPEGEVIDLLDNNTYIDYFQEKVRSNLEPDKLSERIFKSKKILSVFEECKRKGLSNVCQYIESHSKNINQLVKKSAAFACAEEIAKNKPPHIPGYQHENLFIASAIPGGNGLVYYHLGMGSLVLGIFSLQGDGLQNSLYMASLKVIFENACSRFTIDDSPIAILQRIQQSFQEAKFPQALALIGILDFLNNRFSYIRAASPYPYVFNRVRKQGHVEKSTGLPRIGFDLPEQFDKTTPQVITLHEGDILFMGTRDLGRVWQENNCNPKEMSKLPLKEILKKLGQTLKAQNTQERVFESDIYLFAIEVSR